jgi:hypothetical protein
MKNKDQKAIYESYKEEILKKFKQSLESENDTDDVIGDEDLKIEDDIDVATDKDDEIENFKKEVVVKSDEIAVNIGPKLRAIVRNLPNEFDYEDSLAVIQKAIRIAGAEIDEDIKESPLKVYDKLIDLDILSKEVVSDNCDDAEKETGVLMNFNDDDYSEDEDDDENRKDIRKGEVEEIIRQMGTDWRRDDEDYISSNY